MLWSDPKEGGLDSVQKSYQDEKMYYCFKSATDIRIIFPVAVFANKEFISCLEVFVLIL